MFKHATLVSGIVCTLTLGVAAHQSQVPTPQPSNPQNPPSSPRNPPANPNPSTPQNPGAPGTSQPRTTTPGKSDDAMKPATKTAVAPATTNFMKMAAADGMAEVELAQLAQSKASSADVKSYAQMLQTDHSKANNELMSIAKTKNVTLPTEPMSDQKATKARLEKLSGAAFDQAYAKAMVADHTKAVQQFTTASKSADSDVKAFAEKTLPTLKHHLEEAQKLAKNGNSGK